MFFRAYHSIFSKFQMVCTFHRPKFDEKLMFKLAQSVGTIEYANCISAVGKTPKRVSCKQSNGKVPVLIKLWGMQSTPSLASVPGQFWSDNT